MSETPNSDPNEETHVPAAYAGAAHPGLKAINIWAVFVVGVFLLGGLLYAALSGFLSAGQADMVIRVCLALGAAGMAAFLPGLFQLNVPNSITAGGSLAVFVFLIWWNPAGNPAQSELVVRCKDSLFEKQYDIALERCRRAVRQTRDDYAPWHFLGVAQYHSGQYHNAVDSFDKALSLPNADRPMVLYNIAFSRDDNGQPKLALEALEEAAQAAAGRREILQRIRFFMASVQRRLWLAAPADSVMFEKAVISYKTFLEFGTPRFWAHGELACMFAMRAAGEQGGNERTDFERQAVAELEAAVNDLRRFNRPRAKEERTAFSSKFGPSANTPCVKPLKEAWQKQKSQGYEDFFTRL